MKSQVEHRAGKSEMAGKHYRGLAVMSFLSFAAMYVLMYSMVDRFANVYSNVNQFYMAGLMTAPMIAIELVVMRNMYRSSQANIAIGLGSAGLLFLCFLGIRAQVGVTDSQFVRSMIPHHAGAILMCEQVTLRDPELVSLCKGIIAGQRAEIDQMRAKLEALGG